MNALAGLNVLLVEDEFLIALDAEQTLRSLGAGRVEVASTLREADRIASEHDRFDLVVLDVNINGEMSFPVAEKFRARGMPVVFATGYDMRDREAFRGGGVCVEKPYTSERLREALCTALAGAKAAAAPQM